MTTRCTNRSRRVEVPAVLLTSTDVVISTAALGRAGTIQRRRALGFGRCTVFAMHTPRRAAPKASTTRAILIERTFGVRITGTVGDSAAFG
jgi:hypothetical protein